MFPHVEEFKYQLKETIEVSQDEFLPANFKTVAFAKSG